MPSNPKRARVEAPPHAPSAAKERGGTSRGSGKQGVLSSLPPGFRLKRSGGDEEEQQHAEPDETDYEALEILDKRNRKGIQYLVKWADGPNGEKYEPSWEPKANVGLPLIAEYENEVMRRQRGRPRASTTAGKHRRQRSRWPKRRMTWVTCRCGRPTWRVTPR